ncbi:siderophore ABC transporter substrate-binding protein [Enterococcus sp. LJL120]
MKKFLLSVGIVLSLGVLAACGNTTSGTTDSSETASSTSSSTSAGTIEVTDTNGTVEVPQNPEKVVVFDMGSLDTIDALGAGDAVVGTAVSNLPAYLDAYADVESAGGIKEPDIEAINAMAPDLIIISGRQADYLDQLSAIAPTIYLGIDYENTWDSIQDNVKTLGQIFDKEDEAESQLAELQTQIDEVHTQATDDGKNALVLLANEGELSAYGAGSRFGIIHDTFGFSEADDAIEASTHGQSVSFEYVLETNPDIIFVVDRTQAIGGDDSQNNVAENELVQQTTAGQNNLVIMLDPEVWYLSGGGLESVQLMIDDVKQAFQ